MVLHFASFVRRPTGAHALQARRICPVGRVRRKDTSYRHQGAGVENPRLPQRCTRSGRRPASPGSRQRSGTASGGRAQPANILATPTLAQPQKFSPSTPLLSGIVAHTRIRKVSCCFYDGDGPPTAAKTSAHGLTHGLAAASGDCTRTALDATARLRGAAPRLACGPPVDIECGRWRGRPSGPGPIRWRRRAAPLRFAAGRLKP